MLFVTTNYQQLLVSSLFGATVTRSAEPLLSRCDMS
jgi:hypothetical protein